jgi:hypothetical protein
MVYNWTMDAVRAAPALTFDVAGEQLSARPAGVVIAGFTGRDAAAVERHVAELEAEGVPRPASVPAFYPAPAALLTQEPEIAVVHDGTSGEAEIALLVVGGQRYVTLASDHTDRRAETLDVGLSKLACPKPIARAAWRYEDVAPHWDALRIRSWIWEDGERRLYQDGRAAELLAPEDLLARIPLARPQDDHAVLTGTLAAIGGIRPSRQFAAELVDEARGERLELAYGVSVLDLLETA